MLFNSTYILKVIKNCSILFYLINNENVYKNSGYQFSSRYVLNSHFLCGYHSLVSIYYYTLNVMIS